MTDSEYEQPTTLHEVLVFEAFVATPDRWLTAKEIAEHSGVAPRTARAYALQLSQRGVLERVETFGGYRLPDQQGTPARLSLTVSTGQPACSTSR
jgi:predicted transcriptional regulator of viral defense system